MSVMDICLFLFLLSCVYSEFTFSKDTSVISTFIKSYENLAPKLCRQLCADLSNCNSMVVSRNTLTCFLFEEDCESNIIVNQEGSTYGCFSNKTDKCETSDSIKTYIAFSKSGHRCISTECLTTDPNVRNSHVTDRQFDPPKVTLQCNAGYTYKGTSNESVCVPGQGWKQFNSTCYLEGEEEDNPITYGDQFVKPFVSNWTTLESQTANSLKHISHNCGTLPVNVEVQVRSKSGDQYSDFVFNGVSSGMTDDDYPNDYGGVLYKYDDKKVELYAPRVDNDLDHGYSINAGGTTWNGPFQRHEHTADVRVKTWCPSQIKMPTFESIWYPINESDSSYFYEINHHLEEDPRLVFVQLRLGETDQFVDAIGSVSTIDVTYKNLGGLIYGISNVSIRMWRTTSEPLWSNDDGWGETQPNFYNGYVKFRLWTGNDLSIAYKEVPIGENNIVNFTSLPHEMNMDRDLIHISTKVLGGNNAGFSFPADSSVQESNIGNSFGSVVYAFSETELAVWQPIKNGSIGGKLVYIDDPWGDGVNNQHSEDGTLQITIVKGGTDSGS